MARPHIAVNDLRRFYSFFVKCDGCWEWQGTRHSTGRGVFWLNGKHEKAHRVAWIIAKGQIPRGKIICHHCDNGRCVNPGHLFVGTHKDNTQDMIRKWRYVGNRKLNEIDRNMIRELYRTGRWCQVELAKKFNVHYCTINRVINHSK